MDSQQTPERTLRITRQLNARREEVFNAFASKTAFALWWAQRGSVITVKHFEFTSGGSAHFKMQGADQVMWGLLRYRDIVKPEKIEFINSFSDEHGAICRPPFPMEFPFEIFNRVTFTETDGKTLVILEGWPVNATEAQLATYQSISKNIAQGFSMTFDQLESYLADHVEAN